MMYNKVLLSEMYIQYHNKEIPKLWKKSYLDVKSGYKSVKITAYIFMYLFCIMLIF